MKKFLFYLLSCTYGIIQTLIGAFVFLLKIRKKHFLFHGAIVTEWNYGGSVSFGLFIFVNKYQKDYRLLKHEYGHTIQGLILGPLWIFVIGLPSLIWCGCFGNYRFKHNISYYSFYTESWANRLSKKYQNY